MKLLTKLFYLLSFCLVVLTGCKQALSVTPVSNVYNDIQVQESVRLIQIRAAQLTKSFFTPAVPLSKKDKTELIYVEESEDEDSEAHIFKKQPSNASLFFEFRRPANIVPLPKNIDSRFLSSVFDANPVYLKVQSFRI